MALRYEIQEIGTGLLVENWQAGLRCLSQSAEGVQYQDAHLPLPLSHLPDHFLAGIPDELRKVRTSIPRTKNENFSHLISMGYQ